MPYGKLRGKRAAHASWLRTCRRRYSGQVSPACAGNTQPDPLILGLIFIRVSPACAGNTTSRRVRVSPACSNSLAAITGQPRVRGEHGNDGARKRSTYGPGQPRVRGEHRKSEADELLLERVSPACAGNTLWQDIAGDLYAGSAPRARGTLQLCGTNLGNEESGQPRVRGEHFELRAAAGLGRRVSPACAGNTNFARLLEWPATGQPRVRGEHMKHRSHAAIIGPGQPRVRGEHMSSRSDLNLRTGVNRVSPACAGNTQEYGTRWGCPPMGYGSAPRARGTRYPRVRTLGRT